MNMTQESSPAGFARPTARPSNAGVSAPSGWSATRREAGTLLDQRMQWKTGGRTARTPPLDDSDRSVRDCVKCGEFERRVQRLARRKKVAFLFVGDRGKGSHGRLYFATISPPSRIGRRKSAATCWRSCAGI
jgi:hypothetical protein